MVKARQFLAKIQPIPGESLLSLVSAAAAANRLLTVCPAFRLVGASYHHEALHENDKITRPLAALLGIDRAELTSRMYGAATEEGTRTFFGHTVPANWICASKRIAPGKAFGEDARADGKKRRVHEALWDVALFNVCPDTGTILVDHCVRKTCGRKLTWTLSNVTTCNRCGLDMASVEQVVERPSPHDLRGIQFIADLIAPWRERQSAARSELSSALNILSTVELIQLILMIPDFFIEAQTSRLRRYRRWSRRSYLQLATAVDVIKDWPHALHSTLDILIDGHPGKGRCSILGKLGIRVAVTVSRLEEMSEKAGIGCASSAVLLKTMTKYFASRPDLGLREYGALGESIKREFEMNGLETKAFLNLRNAARLVGWGTSSIRRLADIRPEIVSYSDGKGSGAPLILWRTELLKLKTDWEDAMSVNEVSNRLGISYASGLAIIESGVLPLFDHRLAKLKVNRREKTFVSRRIFEKILKRLQVSVRDVPLNPLPLSNAALMFASARLGWGNLLEAILEGHIPHYRGGRENTELPYLLDKAEVIAFLDSVRGDTPYDLLSLTRHLKVPPSTVFALMKAGILDALPHRGKKRAWQFRPDTVAKFRQQFLTTKQVAAFLQRPDIVNRKTLPALLRRHGVKPIVGDGRKVRNVVLIWRLSDVNSANDGLLLELNGNLPCD